MAAPLFRFLTSSQLPDPNATTFSSQALRKAMLDTITSLNTFAEETGITEVCSTLYLSGFMDLTVLLAESYELLCNGW